MKFDKNSETHARYKASAALHSIWTARQIFWMMLLFSVTAVLFMTPSLASAQAVPTAQPFTVKDSDYFINFLLRGLLGDVISPNGASAATTITAPGTLGNIFRTFNLGVTFFGSLIVMFLAVIGILNTGHDGEFLGKRWSSMWVPIRFAGGAALLLPVTTSGYSFVQAMCLWIATQGVGFADNVWSSVLTNVARRSGSEVVSPVSISAITSNVMASKMCQAFVNSRIVETGGAPMVFSTQIVQSAGIISYYEGWGKWRVQNGAVANTAAFRPSDAGCGYMSFSYRPDPQDPSDNVRDRVARAHMEAVRVLDGRFEAAANNYVQTIFSSATTGAVPEATLRASELNIRTAIGSGADWYATYVTAQAQAAIDGGPLANANRMADTFDRMGFAVAGAFYIELAKVQNALRSGMATSPSYTPLDMNTLAAEYSSANMAPVMGAIAEVIGGAALEYSRSTSAMPQPGVVGLNNTVVRTIDLNDDMFKSFNGRSSFAEAIQNLSYTIVRLVIGVGNNNNENTVSSVMVNRPGGTGQSNNISSGSWSSTVSDNHSVIMQMKGKGDAILDVAGIVWTGFVGAKIMAAVGDGNFFVSVANRMFGGGGFLQGVIAGLEAMSAFVFTSVMSLIGIGVVLAIIIPMTPFMLWVMGIAGLLVLIIESLVASVIWAVMLMHPSGEGITSDQSRQGLMILLNLFMRPSLMLMGMVCGIFMVEPMVSFVNDMFFFVFKSTQASSYTMLFITFGFISVYCTLVLSLVKKTFSLIHVVPDSVLAWIGGNPHNLGMSDAADKAEQLAGNSATRVSEGVTSMGRTMTTGKNAHRKSLIAKLGK